MFAKIRSVAYKIYLGIGLFSIALLAACVIFAVFARYIFSLSFKELEEFTTTIFAFSTFWGMTVCFVENEHVCIDSFYDMFPPAVKKLCKFISYITTICVLFVMLKFGYKYAIKFGHQISSGMEVPYIWLYGIIPVGCFTSLIVVIYKFSCFLKSVLDPIFKKGNKEA